MTSEITASDKKYIFWFTKIIFKTTHLSVVITNRKYLNVYDETILNVLKKLLVILKKKDIHLNYVKEIKY